MVAANSINESTIGITGFTGTSFTGTPVTAHNVQVGGATSSTLTSVAPSATTGIPLVSNGAAVDPSFSTAVVAGGGTGATTLTNHGVLLGQATSPIIATSVGATGTVLAGNTGADPTFETIATVGGITTITGNSGGAESPLAGNFNVLGTGSITVAGSANTETVQLTGLTNHNVLLGAGTATITNVAPSATAGIPLVSNGAAADPSFTTAVVAGGGTGATSFGTAYGVICAGTTSTNPLQVTASAGTLGQFLISGGAAAIPSYQTMAPFMYFLNTTTGAVTGAGASYQLQTQASWTADTDVSGVITWPAGIMTFTAPVTGFYCLGVNLSMGSLTAGMTDGFLTIDPSTANRIFIGDRHNVGADRAQGGVNITGMKLSAYLIMASGDTCTFSVQLNNGTNVATITGSATQQLSFVYGNLIQRTA